MIFIHGPSLPISKWELLRVTAVLQLLEAVVHCVVNLDPKSMCVCVCLFVCVQMCSLTQSSPPQDAVLDWTHVHGLLEPTLSWLSICETQCNEEGRYVSGQVRW